MTDKSATVKKEVSSNPNAVEFERDQYGITSNLKREGLRAAGRVAGDEQKLRTLVKALEVLREHAIARYKAQLTIRKHTSDAAIQRDKAERERNEKDRKRSLAIVEKRAAELRAAAPKSEQESE